MRTLDLVAGARPNFVKLAPVHRALLRTGGLKPRIVHTGQHYDRAMSEVFFEQLGIPEPDVHLHVGSGSHAAQTARTLERFETHLLANPPTAVVVFGDVNSTVACSLAAVKLGIPVVHVEAGLRSFDRSMPEEINRVVTDSIAELLLVTEQSGVDNLLREGLAAERVHLVGNVMIDTLRRNLGAARALDKPKNLGLAGSSGYGLVTLHRPANVDVPERLRELLDVLREISRQVPLCLPLHPRTRAVAQHHGIELPVGDPRFLVLEPQPYLDFLGIMAGARFVITDSGGVQEETSALRLPCLTLRPNTERPVTMEIGTSRLIEEGVELRAAVEDVLEGSWPSGAEIPLWDGRAGERVAQVIAEWLACREPAVTDVR